jgi:hypothetical protein
MQKLFAFSDDSLQEVGNLVQGKPLHSVQSHEVAIEADSSFRLTATFAGVRCGASYTFMPRAGEHYEADAQAVCVVRIIHTSTAPDGTSKRTFEPSAERDDSPSCAKQ